jgi:HSP20 family protein
MNLIKFNKPSRNLWPLESMFLTPLRELSSIEPLFDRLLQDHAAVSGRTFECDERDNAYELKIEFPGFTKKEVTVEIEQDILTVSASRKSGEKEEVGAETRRSVHLPQDVETGKSKACLENGVLSVHLPKKIAPKPLKLKLN